MSSTLHTRPRLRKYLREMRDDVGGILFRGGATSVTLRGESVDNLLPDLLPKLDGSRTIAQLVSDLPHVSEEVIRGALAILQEQNLLEEGDHHSSTSERDKPDALSWQEQYWTSFGGESASTQQKLSSSTVIISGLGGVGRSVADVLARSGVGKLRLADGQPVSPEDQLFGYRDDQAGIPRSQAFQQHQRFPAATLETAHFDATDEGGTSESVFEGSSLVVVCADSPREAAMNQVNRLSFRAGVPWLPATAGINHGTIGPLVIPHQTACYECFRLRLISNRSFLNDALGSPVSVDSTGGEFATEVVAAPAFFLSLIGQIAAAEVIRFLTGMARPTTAGAFLSLSPFDAGITRHEVLKLPRCPVCGPVRFRPQMKIWDLTRDEDTTRKTAE
jgi:bacteriocin biosynthesis cyclodehydratase domain-containing protein